MQKFNWLLITVEFVFVLLLETNVHFVIQNRSLVSVKGIIKKLFATTGVLIFGAAAMSMFAISLVSILYIQIC